MLIGCVDRVCREGVLIGCTDRMYYEDGLL